MDDVEIKIKEAMYSKEFRKLKQQYKDHYELNFELNWRYLYTLDQDFLNPKNYEIL